MVGRPWGTLGGGMNTSFPTSASPRTTGTPTWPRTSGTMVSGATSPCRWAPHPGHLLACTQEPPWKSPIATAFVEAGVEMGYENRCVVCWLADLVARDCNGARQTGFMLPQATIRRAARCSTAKVPPGPNTSPGLPAPAQGEDQPGHCPDGPGEAGGTGHLPPGDEGPCGPSEQESKWCQIQKGWEGVQSVC